MAAIFDKISGDLLIYDLYIIHHTSIAVFKKIPCGIREYKTIIAKRSLPLLSFCLMLYSPFVCRSIAESVYPIIIEQKIKSMGHFSQLLPCRTNSVLEMPFKPKFRFKDWDT